MTTDSTPHIRLNVQAKILAAFLVLSVLSLVVTGFFAFAAITRMGTYAGGSSQTLGENAVNDSSYALQMTAEEYLQRVAIDQANITNVLFEDSNSEMNILAAHAAMLPNNSRCRPVFRHILLTFTRLILPLPRLLSSPPVPT